MYPDISGLVQYDPSIACLNDEVFWFNRVELRITLSGIVAEIIEGQPLVCWEGQGEYRWPHNTHDSVYINSVWKSRGAQVFTRGQNVSMSRAISIAILHGKEDQLIKALNNDSAKAL